MSKWIAEFELEDGDTMPEHMDLEYKGVRIDFHCKPLEQEPILDKIRAEIEQIIGEHNLDDYDFCSGLICARKIIDKYKVESEPQESIEKESIPYLMHKKMDIPISACQKAYDVAIDYLRSQAKLKG